MFIDIVKNAQKLAEERFTNITEKNPEKTPYICHLKAVAEMIAKAGGNDIEIAAAWLHDILEDTPTTRDELFDMFGIEVTNVVEALTDPEYYSQLTVEERKAAQLEKLKKASNSVKKIKLADQISAVSIDSRNSNISIQHRILYCEGAHKIAKECSGISVYLDNLFEATYKEALNFLANA